MNNATPALTGLGADRLYSLEAQGLRRFSLQELEAATEGFSKRIGKGGFGEVFKGSMLLPRAPGATTSEGGPSNEGVPQLVMTKIAVKRIPGGRMDDENQFHNESVLLGTLRHPNLVRMYGTGREGAFFLVLELMEGGSLFGALRRSRLPEGERARRAFPWESRLRVMQGAAAGLEFLHSQKVIHRDVKPDNILLSRDFSCTKLTDFGLVRLRADGELETLVYTEVKGTRDYIDPSYLSTGHLGYASDVYSFGIVLMELVTGGHASEPHFVRQTRGAFEGASNGSTPWSSVVDPQLKGSYDEGQVRVVAALAAWCTIENVRGRPSMEVLRSRLDSLRAQ